MCLLNGDLGGSLPHTTDFGIEEYYDTTTGITTYTSIPIKQIIRESIQNFGNELPQNIIINDIEDAGLDLLEYRGDIPLYLFKEETSDTFSNMTINENQKCYYYVDGQWSDDTISISDNIIVYDNLVQLAENIGQPTRIKFAKNSTLVYTVAKMEYGSIPGYRLTDLVYAGDLILNVGENLTALYDKIVSMLGSYEYFYNLDGKFVFQKKPIYTSIPWLNNEKGEQLPIDNSAPMWSFMNNQLVTALQNTPNLSNIRNDFAVWGTKKTTNGSELDIHMRYAIDKKPEQYTTLNWYDNEGKLTKESKTYSIEDGWDWRELIYQMALDYRQNYHNDDFLYKVAQANPQFPTGQTGYEQYYVDLEGFWRLLYNPTPEAKYKEIEDEYPDDVYIQQPYRLATLDELKSLTYKDAYCFENNEMRPFAKSSYCHLQKGITYSYLTTSGIFVNITYTDDRPDNQRLMNNIDISSFYLTNVQDFYVIEQKPFYTADDEQFLVLRYDVASNTTSNMAKMIEQKYAEAIASNIPLYIRDKNKEIYISYKDLSKDMSLKNLYKEYPNKISYTDKDNFGNIKVGQPKIEENAYYYQQYFDYDKETYWNKMVIENPESLLFWFDFLDAEGSDMGKYSTKAIGVRTKAINDKDVKSIYYREIPKVIFQNGQETFEHQTGYTYIQLQNTMENLFTISSKGKSVKERIEELLQDLACCNENISLTTVPIYHLQPNSRILVRDENSNIDGEYYVTKITIPLTYSGTMNITATKVITDLI